MDDVLSIIKNKGLTFEQKVISLARFSENSLDVLKLPENITNYIDSGIICDLGEGNAPYRPRYIVPDYSLFMKNGSSFLDLKAPENIWEAVHYLLILYKHVPSITTFPVYIGNIDTLLDPFISDENEAYQAIKLFLTHIDRTITDSFCHGNIGPEDSRAARLILKATKELQCPTPNITLKYDPGLTPDDLAIDAINTALITAKPSFANHNIFKSEFTASSYGIASCYNGLYVGGGSYTLIRIRLNLLAKRGESPEHFINTLLPDLAKSVLELMDRRIRFIVEESQWFNSFLVEEGFVNKELFTAMFGLVGLAECVNTLLGVNDESLQYGHNVNANKLGLQIIEKLNEIVGKHKAPHVDVFGGKYLLHAQVGIETDEGSSPGCRIPIGKEPEIHNHLIQSAPFHKYFPSGIGDIFKFDETAKKNPEHILDIIKGAFSLDMRYFSLYCADCDVIRISGYLVKRSEIEKLEKGEKVLRDTTALGLGSVKHSRILERKTRK